MGEVAMSDLEGVILGEYLLIRSIVKGSAADVYHARHHGPEHYDVAIKIFHPGYARQESFRSHFMHKAEILGRLDHPHILPLLEFGEGEGLLYCVTPFISTGTLRDLLRLVGGKLSIAQALPLMQQLCGALQYAHDQGVVHGNLKPSNIFIAPNGRVLLTDFDITHGYADNQRSLMSVGWGPAEYAGPERSLGVLRMAMQKRADDRFASASELSNAFLAAVTVAPVTSLLAGTIAPTTSQT